jgi:hypothetical protein
MDKVTGEAKALDGQKKADGVPQRRPDQPLGPALRLALITISAALYAAAIGLTAPIATPWGVGQFRPGVVFPSVFAIIYGPLIGGAGAAIGTFIGDVVFLTPLGLTTPLLSIIAGVPGNFVGFSLLGWFMRRYRSWTGFVVGSFIALLVGNLVAGAGVVIYLAAFSGWSSFPLDTLIGATLGFTFFWLVTMIPFEITLVPPLIRAIQPLLGGRIDLGLSGWQRGTGSEALRSSLAIGGILGAMFLLVQFTALGDLLFKSITAPEFIPWLKLLFLVAAVVVLLFGVVAGLFLRPTQKN